MQAMNASARNAVFGTASALALMAVLAAAALVHLVGDDVVAFAVDMPMNEALAAAGEPVDAAEIWSGCSPRWQMWNQRRAAASGLALPRLGRAL